MGDLYFNGNYVTKNIKKAIEYYKIAGEKGDHYSLLKLGDIYYNGVF